MSMIRAKYLKGQRIREIPVDHKIPLFVLDEKLANLLQKPRQWPESSTESFVCSVLLQSNPCSYFGYALVGALYLILVEEVLAERNPKDSTSAVDSRTSFFKALTSTTQNQTGVESEDDWWCLRESPEKRITADAHKLLLSRANDVSQFGLKRLVRWVYQHQRIVFAEHFVHAHLRTIGSHSCSGSTLWEKNVSELLPNSSTAHGASSILARKKKLLEEYPPLPFAILNTTVDCGNETRNFPPHSCMPTAVLEFVENSDEVSLTAMVDADEASVNCIPLECMAVTMGWEERAQWLEPFFIGTGDSSCACLCSRCRYEADRSNFKQTLSLVELLRVGHFYLANGQLDWSENTLQMIISERAAKGTYSHNEDKTILAEAWHAIGAIALARGHFLKAQRIWQNALSELHPVSHEGLLLQVSKLETYGYLTKANPLDYSSKTHEVRELIPRKAYVARLVDTATCKQILKWLGELENEVWTSQRHYAVPTRDVPLHSTRRIRDWFMRWMETTMEPFLSHYFGVSTNFFVHDAFCVCYEAGISSNHLPIHLDESTHSLIIALNQDYVGGGTYLVDTDTTYRMSEGEVLSFRGDQLEHGGEEVCNGKRYILAAFLYVDDVDSESRGAKTKVSGKKRAASQSILEKAMTGTSTSNDFAFSFSTTS